MWWAIGGGIWLLGMLWGWGIIHVGKMSDRRDGVIDDDD